MGDYNEVNNNYIKGSVRKKLKILKLFSIILLNFNFNLL